MVYDHPIPPSQGELDALRVTAVVVTFNRLDLLPLTLQGLASGKRVPDSVVIVNNASTDGTAAYLDSLDSELNLDIVHLNRNMGGAGGFTVGIDRALARHNPDLVWVMDDDTEPTEDTLSAAMRAWWEYSPTATERPAFVASRVVWTDGRDHRMNTMRTRLGAGRRRTAMAQAVGARPIRSGSFVSLLMDASVMRRVGLPLADFFIWNDDFEYSTRLALHRDAIATADSVARHHTKTMGNTDSNPGPRFYNDVRNKLWVFCRRRTLAPWEKLLYGGASVRLWIRTIKNTDEKKTYLGYLARGVRDALRPYRTNREVLAGVYDLEFDRVPRELDPVKTSQFSVLMSTYAHDHPDFLDRALASNLLEQTLRPDQLVLVTDGPLTAELDAVIDAWQARSEAGEVPLITRVPLQNNVGLASALNEGLRHCQYELVARADADDISLPERFVRQIPQLAASSMALLGSAMYEICAVDERIESTRHSVTDPAEVSRLMARRNPVFHPTVVFRKSAVLSVGGYEQLPAAEDYGLWTRLDRAGYRLANLDEPLVKYRTGAGAYTRRGGLKAFNQDVRVQAALYNGEAVGKAQVLFNLGLRFIYRMVPESARKQLFRTVIGSPRRTGSH